jgi:hypothetical protein
MAAGGVLIVWALYHSAYGSRHQVRIGMQAGFAGLLAWSFVMTSAHGAGLMLVLALAPLCLSESGAGAITLTAFLINALAAVSIHTAALMSVSGGIAILVYDWIGVEFLAAQVDQFGLAVDRSAWHYRNDRACALSSRK